MLKNKILLVIKFALEFAEWDFIRNYILGEIKCGIIFENLQILSLNVLHTIFIKQML